MKLKKTFIYVGAAVLLLFLYKIFFVAKNTDIAHDKQAVIGQQADTNKEEATTTNETELKPVSIDAATKKANEEQIEQLTAKIKAGDLQDGNSYYQRGVLYLHNEQYETAIYDFNSALNSAPNNPYILYNRAIAYFKLFRFDKAITDLNAAINVKADFADAYNTRGLVYVEMQKFSDAMSNYNEAIKISPKFADAYFNQGTLYMREKQYPQAIEAFNQAINNAQQDESGTAKNVKQLQAYLNLARAQMLSGQNADALKNATYVVEQDPKNIEALRLRSEIYNQMGNSTESANDNAAADTLNMQKMLQN